MKRALLVGINDYSWAPLQGCIDDAKHLSEVLRSHHDESPNFACKLLTSDKIQITEAQLNRDLQELFKREGDMALFYFSGHGAEDHLGGYLVTQDAQRYNQGFRVSELINMANNATHIREVLIILDCCHSGHLGNLPEFKGNTALLRKGVSILTASQSNEYAVERGGQGLFTSYVRSALEGGAADILGNVTAASIYDYTDKLLGPWEQRPVFKSHVTELRTIRMCKPKMSFEILRQLTAFFDSEDMEYPLGPEYEPTEGHSNEQKEERFRVLQKYTAANLVEPVGAEHMYYAAVNEKSCRLTHIGKLYWSMVKQNRI